MSIILRMNKAEKRISDLYKKIQKILSIEIPDAPVSPYREYEALLSQSGTGVPTTELLQNATELNPTFGYSSTGKFTINIGTSVPKDKISIDLGLTRFPSTLGDSGTVVLELVDENSSAGVYQIHTKYRSNASATLTFANNLLYRNKLTIKIYD